MDTMSKLAHHCQTPVHRDDLTVSATPGLDARVHHKVRPGRVSVVFGQPRLLSRCLGMCIDEYDVKTRTELPNIRVRVPRSTVQMARMRAAHYHSSYRLHANRTHTDRCAAAEQHHADRTPCKGAPRWE